MPLSEVIPLLIKTKGGLTLLVFVPSFNMKLFHYPTVVTVLHCLHCDEEPSQYSFGVYVFPQEGFRSLYHHLFAVRSTLYPFNIYSYKLNQQNDIQLTVGTFQMANPTKETHLQTHFVRQRLVCQRLGNAHTNTFCMPKTPHLGK